MKLNLIERGRALAVPVWPDRKGLRAPAVPNVPRGKMLPSGPPPGEDRTAQAMAVLTRATA